MQPVATTPSAAALQRERRTFPRSPCQFIIQYRGARQSSWDLTPLKELGHGGARFLAGGEFTPGELVDVRIGLPLFAAPMQLPARVVWQKSTFSGPFKVAETGIAFTNLDTQLIQAIDDTIERLIRQSREKTPSGRPASWPA